MSTIEGGLSVVMPSFNKAPHVARAIQAILDQEDGFDELIIVDDGSTDGTLEQIGLFTDERIRLLRRSPPGSGGYAARNLAIREARGRWIAFLDADDTWHPGFTRALAHLVDSHGAEIGCVFTGFENAFSDSVRSTQRFGARMLGTGVGVLDFAGFLDAWIADRDPPIWTGATCFRKELLLAAGLFPESRCRRGGDKDLWLRVISRTQAAYDPRVLATYHRDSVNMVTRTIGMNVRHCICDTILAMLADSDPHIVERLKHLYNLEVYAYAIAAARTGQVDRSTFEGFFVTQDPLKYVILQALAVTPQQLIESTRRIWRRLRGRV